MRRQLQEVTVDWSVLTHLALFLNAAVASGDYADVTASDVSLRIEDGTIFDFLEERLPNRIDLSNLHNDDRAELIEFWRQLGNATSLSQFRIFRESNGFSVLVAYLLEGIQQRFAKTEGWAAGDPTP